MCWIYLNQEMLWYATVRKDSLRYGSLTVGIEYKKPRMCDKFSKPK